jgi:hypothetical protein
LIPRMGAAGAAIAWGVSIVVPNLSAVVQVRAFLGLRPFGQGFVTVIAASALCFGGLGLAIRTMAGTSAGSFLVFAVLSSSLYGLTLFRNRQRLHLPLLRDAVFPGRTAVRAAG